MVRLCQPFWKFLGVVVWEENPATAGSPPSLMSAISERSVASTEIAQWRWRRCGEADTLEGRTLAEPGSSSKISLVPSVLVVMSANKVDQNNKDECEAADYNCRT